MDAETTKELFDTWTALRVEVAEAIKAYESLSAMGPGDPPYDAILAENKGDTVKTESEKATLLKMHGQRVDELQDEEAEVMDELRDLGVDIDNQLSHLIRFKIQKCEHDPIEQKLRKEVDSLLDTIRPVERVDGELSERRQVGADGFVMSTNDKRELASVEVLDAAAPLNEQDLTPDVMHVHDPKDDWSETAQGTKTDTGAVWLDGDFRLNPQLNKMLKPYQQECLKFVIGRVLADEGALVAHAMGLGKTLTVLASLETFATRTGGKLHAIVACPKSVKTNWRDEILKWNKDGSIELDPCTLSDEGSPDRLRMWLKYGGVLIAGHDQFKKLISSSLLQVSPNMIVVVDEAHLLKTPGTQMYDIIDGLPTRKRIFMTGTPMQNNLKEYFWMIQLLNKGLLGNTIGEFNQLYGNVIDKGMQKDSTSAQITTSERTVQIMRWKAAAVMHDQSGAALVKTLDKKQEFRLLHQCSLPVAKHDSWIQERHNVHDAARGDKVWLTTKLIDAIRAWSPNDSIVVFSTRNDTLQMVANSRHGGIYTGAVHQTSQRDQLIADFRATPGAVLYVATRAGGVGINLSCANRVILIDASWNPADDAQAVSRCFRIGQTKPVFVYRLIAEGTLEEGIYRMNVKKQNLTSRVLDEQEALRIYSRNEVMAFMTSTDDEQASLDAQILANNDPCLLDVIDDVQITSHDALFSHDVVKELTPEERAQTLNDMNSKAPRVEDIWDESDRLATPAALFFEVSFDDKVFTRTVDFSRGTMYVTLSPIVAVPFLRSSLTPSPPVFHEIYAKQVPHAPMSGNDDKDWRKVAVFDASTTSARVMIDPLLETGVYVFRSRLTTQPVASWEDGSWSSWLYGDWSSVSAPVSLA